MKITAVCEVSVEQLAEVFAGLDDDAQARFFCEVARVAEKWPDAPNRQWLDVGQHLRECSCSTPAGRDLVRQIFEGMQ